MPNTTTTPRVLSQTPAAIAARARRAARAAEGTPTPTPTPSTPGTESPVAEVTMPQTVDLSEDVRSYLDTVREHAVTCGKLDCGHLGKSSHRAVRRAVILYTAEGMGATVDLTRESADVTAVFGTLRAAGHARPVYTRGARRAYVAGTPGVTLVMPNAEGIKITPQRRTVFGFMVRGYSATEISSDPARVDRNGEPDPREGLTARNIETVKSHAGYLRRLTGAHDAPSALIALVLAGKLEDPAIRPAD